MAMNTSEDEDSVTIKRQPRRTVRLYSEGEDDEVEEGEDTRDIKGSENVEWTDAGGGGNGADA